MAWFTAIFFLFALFGLVNIIIYGEGPMYILESWRELMWNIHPNIGKLFSCPLCLGTNLGWIFSLMNWFLIPTIAFTPFNIIFAGTGLWWLAMIFDMGLAGGVCWFLHIIEEYIENNTPQFENDDERQQLND